MQIEQLANFEKVDSINLKKYKVNQAFLDVGFDDEEGIGLFGQEPDVFLVTENIASEKQNITVQGAGGVYIIDGSLSIDGDLIFYAYDAYTILVVTGDLNVTGNLIQYQDTQVVVLGNTKVEKTLWLNLSDAGFTVFRGSVFAENWCQTNDSVDDSLITDEQINGRQISKSDADYKDMYEQFDNMTRKL